MTDRFRDLPTDLASPANVAVQIVPSDSSDLAVSTRALYVGGEGNVTVTMVGSDTPVTFVGLGAGMIYPLRIRRVHATGTTAAALVALA